MCGQSVLDKVFVDKVCVDKVWRRAEEEKAEEEPGIQNQKQVRDGPKTKTKLYNELLSAAGKRPQMRNMAILWTHSPIVK